jgi:hypothetical protein
MAARALQYEPLQTDQIRLLTIEARPSQGADLSLTMSNWNLVDVGEYNALSYAWGDGKYTLPISVNGCAFPITKNLHDALVYVEENLRRDVTMLLWVDAICINQHDVGEKSGQVPRIGQIYSSADMVFLWHDTEAAQTACHLFTKLYDPIFGNFPYVGGDYEKAYAALPSSRHGILKTRRRKS